MGYGPMVYIRSGNALIGISSRAAFIDNPDLAKRHKIAQDILSILQPQLLAKQ
jgi:hypothetical protein